jgi:hypothetical protein
MGHASPLSPQHDLKLEKHQQKRTLDNHAIFSYLFAAVVEAVMYLAALRLERGPMISFSVNLSMSRSCEVEAEGFFLFRFSCILYHSTLCPDIEERGDRRSLS